MDVAELLNNRLVTTLIVPVIIAVLAATAFLLNKKKVTSGSKLQHDKLPVRSSSEKRKKTTTVLTPSSSTSAVKASSPVKKQEAATKSKTPPAVVVPAKQEKKRTNGKTPAAVATKPKSSKKVITNQANKSVGVQNSKQQTKTIKTKTLENDEFVGGDLGEWQTVLTKKQKKQQTQDPLIQAVAEVAAATKGGAKVKVQKKNPKSAGKKKSTTIAPIATSEEKEVVNGFVPTTQISSEPQSISQLNMTPSGADDDWTETKPLKKTKRRALRE